MSFKLTYRDHEEAAGRNKLLARSKHLNLTWISIHESKYKSLAQIYHPDVHKSGVTGLTSEGPTQHMQMINCSCEYLKECFERGTRTYRREREREGEGMREEDNWIQSMSKREQSILSIRQWLVHPLITQYPDTCNQQQSVPALFGCVLAYLFNQELALRTKKGERSLSGKGTIRGKECGITNLCPV